MGQNERLLALNLAVERAPDAPVNYLLRGEYWLEHQRPSLAREDLEQALMLAQTQLDTLDWGYIYQSYIDRASQLLAYIETIKE